MWLKNVHEEELLVMSALLQPAIFMNVFKYSSKLIFIFIESCDKNVQLCIHMSILKKKKKQLKTTENIALRVLHRNKQCEKHFPAYPEKCSLTFSA